MFRFTVRELVLLTLVVALGCGWIVEHGRAQWLGARLKESQRQLTDQREESQSEIRRLHRVNEIIAAQWANALRQVPSTRP
jgi:cell division protein FtsB